MNKKENGSAVQRTVTMSGIQVSRLITARIQAIACIDSLYGLGEHGILHWPDIQSCNKIMRHRIAEVTTNAQFFNHTNKVLIIAKGLCLSVPLLDPSNHSVWRIKNIFKPNSLPRGLLTSLLETRCSYRQREG
jgi:hypothetical protein